MNNDPLEQLLVSENQTINKQDLATLLLPYATINKDTKNFEFTRNFGDLINVDKILIILSAIKARSLILGTEDKIAPSDIIKMQIAPVGSIKATLKFLSDAKQIKSEKGKYFLPNYKISQVLSHFNNLKK